VADPTTRLRPCCDEMAAEIKEDYIFSVFVHEPFTPERPLSEPTVFLCSDGGHGGVAPIRFCPFCGVQIVFEAVQHG
jgi:hypothetical protein